MVRALDRFEEVARALPPPFLVQLDAEIQRDVNAPPAIAQIFADVLQEISASHARPARVPNVGQRR